MISNFSLNLETVEIKIYVLKMLFLQIYTVITFLKFNNFKIGKFEKIVCFIWILISVVLSTIIKYKINYLMSIIFCIFMLSLISFSITKSYLSYTILMIAISLGLNYTMNFVGIVCTYIINKIYLIQSDYVNVMFISMIHFICLLILLTNKKIKNGIEYLKDKSKNNYLNILILNISLILIFTFIIFSEMEIKSKLSKNILVEFIMFSAIMIITIRESIQEYYKQKLLIQDLNETKKDLEIKTKEVQTLEQENLSYSKKAHSLEHKLKSLENKINKLTYNQEISKEIGIDKEIKDISNQIHNNIVYVELDKTGIEELDDMLDTMRNEAIKNNIEFNLQLKGNIYQMTNNYIDKQDLAILLADHIKDAIIAINHTENINKSILVRLGKIDNCFALYIYDTGVEFKKEVLDNLGKIPITTYKEEGGTGMGFMNTFDTLNKTNASLTIKQIGPPSKDNYTKVIMITFDGKHEFKII